MWDTEGVAVNPINLSLCIIMSGAIRPLQYVLQNKFLFVLLGLFFSFLVFNSLFRLLNSLVLVEQKLS